MGRFRVKTADEMPASEFSLKHCNVDRLGWTSILDQSLYV
jgi:hypothetical protein